jgi:hypothetical protein
MRLFKAKKRDDTAKKHDDTLSTVYTSTMEDIPSTVCANSSAMGNHTTGFSYYENIKALLVPKDLRHAPPRNTPLLLVLDPSIGAGGVKFGMTMDEVIGIWGKPSSLTIDPIMRHPKDLKVTLFFGASNFEFIGDELGKILIHQVSLPNAKFGNGIGFASSRAKVVRAFGQPSERSRGEAVPEFMVDGTEVSFYFGSTFNELHGQSHAITLCREGSFH